MPNAIVTDPIGPIAGVESGGSDPILLYAGIGAGAGVLILCCLVSELVTENCASRNFARSDTWPNYANSLM